MKTLWISLLLAGSCFGGPAVNGPGTQAVWEFTGAYGPESSQLALTVGPNGGQKCFFARLTVTRVETWTTPNPRHAALSLYVQNAGAGEATATVGTPVPCLANGTPNPAGMFWRIDDGIAYDPAGEWVVRLIGDEDAQAVKVRINGTTVLTAAIPGPDAWTAEQCIYLETVNTPGPQVVNIAPTVVGYDHVVTDSGQVYEDGPWVVHAKLLPPVGGNMALLPDGWAAVARRSPAGGYVIGVDAWQRRELAEALAATAIPGDTDCLHALQAGPALAFAPGSEATLDHGDTWGAPGVDEVAIGGLDDGRSVALHRDSQQIVGVVYRADQALALWNQLGRPYPHLPVESTVAEVPFCRPVAWRNGNGLWEVGAFSEGQWRTWTSPDGQTWTANEAQDTDAGLYAGLTLGIGVGGQQVLAGHDGATGAFVALYRTAPGTGWQGPYTIAASDTAAAPYIIQLPTGTWETGWLIGGEWTQYRAASPALTWTEVA